MTPRLWAMFFSFVPGGLAYVGAFLMPWPDWVRLISFVVALACTILFVFLAGYELMDAWRAQRYAAWQTTDGRMYKVMIEFTQALANMSGSTAKEIFRVAILRVKGLPGVPMTWEISMGNGVELGFMVEYLRACADIYDASNGHLWPIRNHTDIRFQPWTMVEQQITDITDWMISFGYAMPVHGNQSAMWVQGYHPAQILDEMLLNYLRGLM